MTRPCICFVTDDLAGVGRDEGAGDDVALTSLLAEREWDVHVLFCGPAGDERAGAAASRAISVNWLDDEPAPAWHGIPRFGDGQGALATSQRAFEALLRLHGEHRFDVIEFSAGGVLGFRAVQAKRAGAAFADARLAVRPHATTGSRGTRRSPWELQVEHCERYAVEHADVQLGPSEPEGSYRALLATAASAPPAQAEGTVTVAVTHFEHPDYLPAALASLANQTRAADEVLVIDDGSTKQASRRVFAEQEALYPQWTFLRQPNAGPGAARNACLARSSSDYFLPFDSDNIAQPALVQTLMTAVLTDGRDAATCHMLGFADEQDIAAGRFSFYFAPTGGPRVLTLLENVFGDTCGLFRTQALRAVGGFETTRWSPHEDWETYTKLAFAGFRVDVVPRALFFYRAEIGGRLDRLTADPAQAHRLRQRMIDLLADVELDREERIALWECLLGFAHPQDELRALQATHDELAEWAHRTIDELNAWRAAQLEELREFLTAKVAEATSRAEDAEAQLAAPSSAQRRSGAGLHRLLARVRRP